MKKNKLPSLVTILVMTLVTIVMWISLSIYRALSQKPSPSVSKEVIQPLTPTLDTKSLDQIKTRIFLDDSQIPEVAIIKSATTGAEMVPSPSPVPSPSQATDSGATPAGP